MVSLRFATHEKYPIESFRHARLPPTLDQITGLVKSSKPNAQLKKILNPVLGNYMLTFPYIEMLI